MRCVWLSLAFCLLGIGFYALNAYADGFSVLEENDLYHPRGHDNDYSHGLLISYHIDALETKGYEHDVLEFIHDSVPMFQGNGLRQAELMLGQNLYTPVNSRGSVPNPSDRPYAAWLYAGAAAMEDHAGRSLDYAELLAGVVGPAAAGRQVQNWVHDATGSSRHLGWDYQLDNEPGLALSLEKKWRFHAPLDFAPNLGVEAIPQAGITLGNVWTYAQTGALFRFGQHLLANYGTPRIRPALSGTNYFNPVAMAGPVAWNIYAGAEGRAVARNMFLDGNLFSESRSIDKKPMVGTLVGGVSLIFQEGPTLDLAYVWCSQEADISRECSHYGGIGLGWNF